MLLCVKIFEEYSIGWNMFDGVKKGQISLTCLNNSNISSIHAPFLVKGGVLAFSAIENWAFGMYDVGSSSPLCFSLSFFLFGLGFSYLLFLFS